jgi:hypothetical protein
MEKTRKFTKRLSVSGKGFDQTVEMDLISGLGSITMMEIEDVPFVWCISKDNIPMLEIPNVLAEMEDSLFEYGNKETGDLMVDTLIEKGFFEVTELSFDYEIDNMIDDEPEG